jgi:transcriptional regulator with GAF, ATPase, and Fis domain
MAGMSANRLERAVPEMLGRMAAFFRADRVLFEPTTPDGEYVGRRYRWSSSAVDPALDVLPKRTLPLSKAVVQRRQPFRYSSIEQFPEEWTKERRFLAKTGIRSAMASPVLACGVPVGLLIFEFWVSERVISDQDMDRLRILGDILASVVTRLSAEEAALKCLKLEHRLRLILDRISGCPIADLAQVIDRSLAELGGHFDAQQVALLRFSESGDLQSGSHLWFSEALDADDLVSEAFRQSYRHVCSRLSRDGMFMYGGIQSYAMGPEHLRLFHARGSEAGDDEARGGRMTTEHSWPTELEFLQSAGVFAGAIFRAADSAPSLEAIAIGITGEVGPWPAEIIHRLSFIARALFDAIDRRANEENRERQLFELSELRDRLGAENVLLLKELQKTHELHAMVGRSRAFRQTLALVKTVAPTDSTVLLLGETGTGKDLISNEIHRESGRADRPMIRVNCAALPPLLIESELFGHERGAFTGAVLRMIGRFEAADRGTLFLNEIGDLPLEVQSKLLRALDHGEFERLGSTETRRADVRLIAATNRDIEGLVEAGRFRSDLYYRLSVFPIHVPPLRERAQDIPLLVWFFIGELNAKLGKKVDRIPRKLMDRLMSYEWPGNVRELKNLLERSLITSHGATLGIEEGLLSALPRADSAPLGATPAIDRLKDVERDHILTVLARCRWRISGLGGAAERLGLSRSTLYSRMRSLGISRTDPD